MGGKLKSSNLSKPLLRQLSTPKDLIPSQGKGFFIFA
jgi:hypothetical protein